MKDVNEYKEISESLGKENGYIEKHKQIILNKNNDIDTCYEFADAWARYQILRMQQNPSSGGGYQAPAEAKDIPYVVNGESTTASNVQEALDLIMEKINYVEPKITSFTMSPSTTVYENGASISKLTFNWSTNKNIESQTLTSVSSLKDTDRTATVNEVIKSNKSYTLTINDGKNTDTKTISISFQDKVYYGSAGTKDNYDSSFILGLDTNKFATAIKGNYSIKVKDNEYGWLCVPSNFTSISTWFIGGFELDLVKEATISFTNASGGKKNYILYRTSQPGLGNIEITVK